MSSLKDRIKAARKHAELTQLELAKRVGVSQPVISQLEKGENLQSVHLVKIAGICGVDALWLSEGRGSMLPTGVIVEPGESAADIVRKMLEKNGQGLPSSAREKILSAVEAGSETASGSNVITGDFSRRTTTGDEIRIAHYDVRGSLGGGQQVHDYPEVVQDLVVSQSHLRELGVTYKDASHLKMITGFGQSMEPTIHNLDPMIVDVSIRDFNGDGIYALIWQGHFYVKRLQIADEDHFLMISDNPLHQPRPIRMDDTYIQARVLLVWNAKKV